MNYITYFAHGDIGYINECRFSLLKILEVYNLRPPGTLGILLYTDKPQLFEIFIPFFKEFIIEEVDAPRIKAWIGPTGYVHRAKSKMIQEALQKYNSNLLFFDTDTYITAPIDSVWNPISDGVLYLHQSEGVMDRTVNPAFKKWDKFLETAVIPYGDKQYVHSKFFQVWNSGVVGIAPHRAAVMDEVILFSDALYSQFKRHITEQVACSYCFQQLAEVRPAREAVFHYWNLKEFRQLLAVFFERNAEESIPNLVKKAHHINVAAILKGKLAYENLSPLQRLLKKATGKAWRIGLYTKKL